MNLIGKLLEWSINRS